MDKKQEAALIDSTLKLLRRGKFELSGEEALVFHQCFSYLVKKLNEINKPDVTVSPAPITENIKTSKKK